MYLFTKPWNCVYVSMVGDISTLLCTRTKNNTRTKKQTHHFFCHWKFLVLWQLNFLLAFGLFTSFFFLHTRCFLFPQDIITTGPKEFMKSTSARSFPEIFSPWTKNSRAWLANQLFQKRASSIIIVMVIFSCLIWSRWKNNYCDLFWSIQIFFFETQNIENITKRTDKETKPFVATDSTLCQHIVTNENHV